MTNQTQKTIEEIMLKPAKWNLDDWVKAKQALLDHLKAQPELQKQQLLTGASHGRISNEFLNEAIEIANRETDRVIAMIERELGTKEAK